jgi:hypothetical protein
LYLATEVFVSLSGSGSAGFIVISPVSNNIRKTGVLLAHHCALRTGISGSDAIEAFDSWNDLDARHGCEGGIL